MDEKFKILQEAFNRLLDMPVYNFEVLTELIKERISGGTDTSEKTDHLYASILITGVKNGEIIQERSLPYIIVKLDLPLLSWIFSLTDRSSIEEELDMYLFVRVYYYEDVVYHYINKADGLYFYRVNVNPDNTRRFVYGDTSEKWTYYDLKQELVSRSTRYFMRHPSVFIRTAAFLAEGSSGGVARICEGCFFPLNVRHSTGGYPLNGFVDKPPFPYPAMFVEPVISYFEPSILFLGSSGNFALCGGRQESITNWSREIELSRAYVDILGEKGWEEQSQTSNVKTYVNLVKNINWSRLKLGLARTVLNANK